jgi:hypothetical protein
MINLQHNLDCLRAVIKTIQDDIQPEVDMNVMDGLPPKLAMYIMLESIGELSAIITKEINKLQPIIADRVQSQMVADELDSVEFQGYRYSPSSKTYFSINSTNKPDVIKWLKEHPVGCELVKEDVNIQSFGKFVKEHLDPIGEALPQGVSRFDKPVLSVRKA